MQFLILLYRTFLCDVERNSFSFQCLKMYKPASVFHPESHFEWHENASESTANYLSVKFLQRFDLGTTDAFSNMEPGQFKCSPTSHDALCLVCLNNVWVQTLLDVFCLTSTQW